jgi:hypothetical protein
MSDCVFVKGLVPHAIAATFYDVGVSVARPRDGRRRR